MQSSVQHKIQEEPMIRLLVIVPYPELKEIVDYVLAHHPERERLDADVR